MTTHRKLVTVLLPLFCFLSLAQPAWPQIRTQQQTQQQTQDEKPAPPNCAADIRFTNPETLPIQEVKDPTAPSDGRRPADVIFLQILTATGNPLDQCLPGAIHLSATYFDVDDNPICSGSVAAAAEHGSYLGKPTSFSPVRSTFLEIRPFNVLEFVRWMNPPIPTPNATRATRLSCLSVDGLSEVSPTALVRAATLRIYATFVTNSIGVATAGWRFMLAPATPPSR